jgi:hypothetical protein
MHFGEGLVATAMISGSAGARPTDPRCSTGSLARFMREGWSV